MQCLEKITSDKARDLLLEKNDRILKSLFWTWKRTKELLIWPQTFCYGEQYLSLEGKAEGNSTYRRTWPFACVISPFFVPLRVSRPAFLSFHFLLSLHPPLLGIHACAAINTLAHKGQVKRFQICVLMVHNENWKRTKVPKVMFLCLGNSGWESETVAGGSGAGPSSL